MKWYFLVLMVILGCKTDQKEIMRNRQAAIKKEIVDRNNKIKELSAFFDNEHDSLRRRTIEDSLRPIILELMSTAKLEREYDSLENEFKKY